MGIMIRNMCFCRRYQQLLLRLLRSVLLIGKNLGKPPTRKYKVQSGKHFPLIQIVIYLERLQIVFYVEVVLHYVRFVFTICIDYYNAGTH
jgi:hypothetical protein